MTRPPAAPEPRFSEDRVVRARKRRQCTSIKCAGTGWIEPGDFYLDENPPMRQSGYFAACIPCAVARGRVFLDGVR